MPFSICLPKSANGPENDAISPILIVACGRASSPGFLPHDSAKASARIAAAARIEALGADDDMGTYGVGAGGGDRMVTENWYSIPTPKPWTSAPGAAGPPSGGNVE